MGHGRAAYVALAAALRRLPLAALPAPDHALVLVAAPAVLAGLYRARLPRAQRLLDHLIFKDAYAYRPSLRRLSRDLSRARDLDALGATLPARLHRLMTLDFAALLVYAEGGAPHVRGVAGADRAALLPALAAAARGVRYLSTIMGKLGDRSRTEAVALAAQRGLIVLER